LLFHLSGGETKRFGDCARDFPLLSLGIIMLVTGSVSAKIRNNGVASTPHRPFPDGRIPVEIAIGYELSRE
jgi:hypothetical protein